MDDVIVNTYVEKIFEELNAVNKERIILRTNAEIAKVDIERLKETESRLNERVSALELELNSAGATIENLRNRVGAAEERADVAEGKVATHEKYASFDITQKTELLAQVADLKEKLRLAQNSNAFLIKSVKDKDAKIASLKGSEPIDKVNPKPLKKKSKKSVEVSASV